MLKERNVLQKPKLVFEPCLGHITLMQYLKGINIHIKRFEPRSYFICIVGNYMIFWVGIVLNIIGLSTYIQVCALLNNHIPPA